PTSGESWSPLASCSSGTASCLMVTLHRKRSSATRGKESAHLLNLNRDSDRLSGRQVPAGFGHRGPRQPIPNDLKDGLMDVPKTELPIQLRDDAVEGSVQVAPAVGADRGMLLLLAI